jgi:hypothetical protein
MGSVLNIENGMTKTGLAVCWVFWLWIRHAARYGKIMIYLTLQDNLEMYIRED